MKPITFVIGLFAGSPGRARTYNNSVNSRVLCHWATEEYWVGVKKDVLRLFLRKIPGVISETLFSSRISAAVLFSPYVCSAFPFFAEHLQLFALSASSRFHSLLNGYKEENLFSSLPWKGIRRRPTLPGRLQPSTIGAERLNFCVRDGYRWNPLAIATGILYQVVNLSANTLKTAQWKVDLDLSTLSSL